MNREKAFNGGAFAAKLKSFRGELSQDDLATGLGMSQSRVARLELGWEPHASELMILSERFKVSILDLLDLSPLPESTGSESLPYTYNPESEHWHKLLEVILNSGKGDAIGIIRNALEVWSARIQEEEEMKGSLEALKREMKKDMNDLRQELLERLIVSDSSGTGTDGNP